MNFYIQAGIPIITRTHSLEDHTLSDAIETVFPMNTENMILYWNHIPISLSYKYDLAYMFPDILDLFEAFSLTSKGEMCIQWLPDTFRSNWILKWRSNNSEIETHWENVVGNVQELLNRHNQVKIPIDAFMCEWKKVFNNIICGLVSCGYSQSDLQDFERFAKIYYSIPRQGVLYEEDKSAICMNPK